MLGLARAWSGRPLHLVWGIGRSVLSHGRGLLVAWSEQFSRALDLGAEFVFYRSIVTVLEIVFEIATDVAVIVRGET